MTALFWMGHTLEAVFALACLVFGLGLGGCLAWWLRRPVLSQREREAMFLAHQAALFVAHRHALRAAA